MVAKKSSCTAENECKNMENITSDEKFRLQSNSKSADGCYSKNPRLRTGTYNKNHSALSCHIISINLPTMRRREILALPVHFAGRRLG